MKTSFRLLFLALACVVASPLLGCAGRQGSSFETLGVPEPEDRPGRSPLILGWAREERGGWVINSVRIDDRAQREWNEETQRPAIFYLTPGSYEMRLNAAQLRDPRDRDSRPRRRYRIRPFRVELESDTAQVCVIRVDGDERRRPRVQCESRDMGSSGEDEYQEEGDEYGDEYADEDETGDEEPVEEPAPVAAAAEPPTAAGAEVPSPFDPPTAPPAREQPAEAAPAPSAPVAVAAPPAPAEAAPAGPRPRPLSQEERIERLERQIEELRRQIRQR